MNNQGAFDAALLHLLNQGHRSVSSTGRSQLRGPRGKSAIGALIPDRVYGPALEGKTIQQLLSARGTEFDPVRAHLSGVAQPLLTELQDLHDRTGECLPSLFREMMLAGAQRIAKMYGLSMRAVKLCNIYRKLNGPRGERKAKPPAPIAKLHVVNARAEPIARVEPPAAMPVPVPVPVAVTFELPKVELPKVNSADAARAALEALFMK